MKPTAESAWAPRLTDRTGFDIESSLAEIVKCLNGDDDSTNGAA
jgi:hypothetical protein